MAGIKDLFQPAEKIEREEATVDFRKDQKTDIEKIAKESGHTFEHVHDLLLETALDQYRKMKRRAS